VSRHLKEVIALKNLPTGLNLDQIFIFRIVRMQAKKFFVYSAKLSSLFLKTLHLMNLFSPSLKAFKFHKTFFSSSTK
jgi:hypothetical protein